MLKTHEIKKIRFACFAVSAFFVLSKIPDIYHEICHNNEMSHYDFESDISTLEITVVVGDENENNDDFFEI